MINAQARSAQVTTISFQATAFEPLSAAAQATGQAKLKIVNFDFQQLVGGQAQAGGNITADELSIKVPLLTLLRSPSVAT